MTRINRLLLVWILAQGITTGFSQTEFSTCNQIGAVRTEGPPIVGLGEKGKLHELINRRFLAVIRKFTDDWSYACDAYVPASGNEKGCSIHMEQPFPG